jgi:septal ring factor EnvC (AmiA/AmiB activator)
VRLAVVVLALAGGVAGASRAGAGTSNRRLADTIDARIAAVEKTADLLDDKYADRSAETRQRVRALYKLTRSGWARLWFDADERRAALLRRAAARRILRRDFRELALLRKEIAAAVAAEERLQKERVQAPEVRLPPRGGLLPPVDGPMLTRFGSYRHRGSSARLTRRGVELRSSTGQEVRAPAAGEVRYSGAVRGLGNAVVIEHGDYYSVIGNLAALRVGLGAAVKPGDVLGKAAGRRIYVEIRLALGSGGQPIDPEPLFGN